MTTPPPLGRIFGIYSRFKVRFFHFWEIDFRICSGECLCLFSVWILKT